MEKIFIGFLLALIPVVNFYLKYYFSNKVGELSLFKKHFTTYYVDWVFVPFNFFWVYAFNLSYRVLGFFAIISILAFVFLMFYWKKLHKDEKNKVYMFDIRTGLYKPAGFVEMIFFTIEAVMILGFLFSNLINIFVFVNLGVLLAFFLMAIPSSIKIHGKLVPSDLAFFIFGLFIVVFKLLFILI